MTPFAVRRWFQFKLRTVMLAATVLSLLLGWVATRLHRGRQQRPIVETVEREGGRVWVVDELGAKDAASRLADLERGGPGLFDSQRPEIGAVQQMVEDAEAGDVVCIAFAAGVMRDIIEEGGLPRPRISGEDGEPVHNGWKLHFNSFDPWGARADRVPVALQPIDWLALAAFPSLQVLDLGARPVNDEELANIARSADLRALLARRANITDVGLAAIARLKNLRVLSLYESQMTDDGLRHLAGLLRLEVLELDHSQIRGEGLKHLAGLSQLKLLSLRETPLADEGLEHLAKLTELRRLYLYRTSITDAGLAKLRPLKKLEILHLGGTAVTFDGANEFEKDLPRSPIIR